MKVFKIRNQKTGLFSTGGLLPNWTHQGKVWQRINHVHSHICQLTTDYTPADIYKDAEIVEAEITEILIPIGEPKEYLNKKYDEAIIRYNKLMEERPNDTFYPRQLERVRERKALLNELS